MARRSNEWKRTQSRKCWIHARMERLNAKRDRLLTEMSELLLTDAVLDRLGFILPPQNEG